MEKAQIEKQLHISKENQDKVQKKKKTRAEIIEN